VAGRNYSRDQAAACKGQLISQAQFDITFVEFEANWQAQIAEQQAIVAKKTLRAPVSTVNLGQFGP